MAQARLRRTFRYPEDEDMPADLDEQGWDAPVYYQHVTNDLLEQEKLISELKTQNDDRNLQYLVSCMGLR